MFVALGLTIDFTDLPASAWRDGVVLAIVVALVARPLVVLTLLLPRGCASGSDCSSPGAG